MTQIIQKTLTICLLGWLFPVTAQQIWHESFVLPGKGIWGDGDGGMQSDFTGIKNWQLKYSDINLQDMGDYAKTVTTSGGRFEACDLDGEVVWESEWILIPANQKVHLQLTASETGSGANASTKYLKACYRTGPGKEFTFEENGINTGNWGSAIARQMNIHADSLQVVCYISTHYSSDKVILDEVKVWHEQEPMAPVYPFDVVINELMADPSPPVGLPEAEYIELYNTLEVAVNTAGWELRINGVKKKVPEIVIAPRSFLLLCSTGAYERLYYYGDAAGIAGFQGLLNKGAQVEILDGKGNTIDRIDYSNSWYGDPSKSNGGWSLERIDPFRQCNQPANWKASLHPDGGSPGKVNSVFADNPDLVAPSLKWAVAVSANEAELAFTEPIDTALLLNPTYYSLSEFGNPVAVETVDSKKILLHFKDPFQLNKTYTLQTGQFADECGNAMAESSCEIQWNIVEPGDLLINELLFDPVPGGEDYVEIYNNSDKLIDLSLLFLSTRDKNSELVQVYPLTRDRRVLLPDSFMALTKDTNGVFPWFHIKCSSCFIQVEKIPSFPNGEGHVVVLNQERSLIDEFAYSEKMHSPFLANAEGVSLERRSFSAGTNEKGNWHSASAEAGYGTPGYKNSQMEGVFADRPVVHFEPESFSPNNDGYNDIFLIEYETGQPGFVANVKIFDSSGRFVQDLVKNEMLSTAGSISWNGEDRTGRRQQAGVYVVWVEFFNAAGEVYRFKKGVVLTEILQ
jgi:hypothetical protein